MCFLAFVSKIDANSRGFIISNMKWKYLMNKEKEYTNPKSKEDSSINEIVGGRKAFTNKSKIESVMTVTKPRENLLYMGILRPPWTP